MPPPLPVGERQAVHQIRYEGTVVLIAGEELVGPLRHLVTTTLAEGAAPLLLHPFTEKKHGPGLSYCNHRPRPTRWPAACCQAGSTPRRSRPSYPRSARTRGWPRGPR